VVGTCSYFISFQYYHSFLFQNNAKLYPTLSRIALDVLPSQASSVPCERAFSSAKLTGSDRRSRMKAEIFEILQILKAKWRGNLINLEELEELEVVHDSEFIGFLLADQEQNSWENDELELSYA
jgi:hypothetical protein